MIREVDSDNSGTVDYQEFLRAFLPPEESKSPVAAVAEDEDAHPIDQKYHNQLAAAAAGQAAARPKKSGGLFSCCFSAPEDPEPDRV